MTQDKIEKLIELENERREENMLHQARELISAIGEEMTAIDCHNANIAKLRAKLKALETTPINATAIIG